MAKKSNPMKARLAGMQDRWESGKDEMPGLPEGTYEMRLASVPEIVESPSSGQLRIVREHVVLDGDRAGEVCKDGLSLETEYGPYFVSQWVEQMGYDAPEDLTELPEILEEIFNAGLTYTAKVSISGTFRNVNIVEVYEPEFEEEESEEEEEPGEDEEESEEEEEPGEDEEESEEEEESDGTLEDLITFAEAMAIELEDPESMSLEDIVEVLSEYEFDRSQLSPEEAALLVSLDLLEAPKPKKSAAATPAKAKSKSAPAPAPVKAKPKKSAAATPAKAVGKRKSR